MCFLLHSLLMIFTIYLQREDLYSIQLNLYYFKAYSIQWNGIER